MAFETVASLDADTTTALGGTDKKTGKKNPTQVEGYYLGFRLVDSKKGEAKLHVIQTPKGNIGVWGKTNMNSQLLGVKPGTMVRVSFTGMLPTKNGDMYKYKVEVDKTNTVEVANLTAGEANEALDEGGYSADDTDDGATYGEDTDGDADAEEEAQVQALLQAEKIAAQKAKVQALLNKNKK